MRNAFEIARAFTLMFFRDRLNLFFTFFFNAFLMVLLGLTVADRFSMQVKLGVADRAQSAISETVIARMATSPNLKIQRFASEAELTRRVTDGTLVAGIVVDRAAGAAASTPGAPGTQVRVIADPSRKMWIEMLKPGLTVAMLEADPSGRTALQTVSIRGRETESRNLSYFDFIFPGVIAFSIMQIALSGGLALLRYRKNETLKRLKLTPLERHEFLLGYTASQLFVLLLQVLVHVGIAKAVFGYSFHGSLGAIALTTLLGSLLFIACGLLVSTLSPSVESGGNLVRFLSFPTAFLCGVYVPLDSLPERLAQLSYLYPLTPFVQTLRSSANYAAPLAANALNLAVMGGVLVVAAALVLRTFTWEEQAA
ncbi:MAG TPA: ABC transporter permease [Longimicrobiaceae bacterium]|nr:ABC transporter permease [Longimicrobiaceae bacterium]